MKNENDKIAKLSREGFIELVYAENINVINQNNVLQLGLEIANEAGILKGMNILIDASKTKTYDKPAVALTKHASKSVEISHIAIFGPKESQDLLKEMGKSFDPNINNLIKYFETREEAVNWLYEVNINSPKCCCNNNEQ